MFYFLTFTPDLSLDKWKKDECTNDGNYIYFCPFFFFFNYCF